MTEGDADFVYRNWIVRVEIEPAGEAISGHADLYWRGQHKCRVALATSRLDPTRARLALGTKARAFIDGWIARPHAGDSGFCDIQAGDSAPP
ncbi:hypothetical protein QTI33_26405 [Variovorax sp. J22P271]|uniref:hypothetical protein n=1 Tax=Variovorax davisae TaxID=3053515 RepID=UPI00257750C8|nr:hypothetical protein [Variovorax sp. J22P271]MDM0035693.1 hypothetical protein [Variovorax sp. J22P271]